MNAWEKFELNCTDFLNRQFGAYATFYHEGGSDSTKPDIRVETKTNQVFYMDVKDCPAQCGQFVLLPNLSTNTFDYSVLNVSEINPSSKQIIAHMNEHFEYYKEAGTAGKNINIENGSAIFADWIIRMYKNKGVRFFITNNYAIVPIDAFPDYFSVTAQYRVKRSGSDNVGKRSLPAVKHAVECGNYAVTAMRSTSAGKLFVSSDRNLHNIRFRIDGREFMFSVRKSEYEVRKLSNTFNANVIFAIDRKPGVKGLTEDAFISRLR